jgi:hypothetical protein
MNDSEKTGQLLRFSYEWTVFILIKRKGHKEKCTQRE